MDWQIESSPVHFKSTGAGVLAPIHTFPDQKVLYRSDTQEPLSVVSVTSAPKAIKLLRKRPRRVRPSKVSSDSPYSRDITWA